MVRLPIPSCNATGRPRVGPPRTEAPGPTSGRRDTVTAARPPLQDRTASTPGALDFWKTRGAPASRWRRRRSTRKAIRGQHEERDLRLEHLQRERPGTIDDQSDEPDARHDQVHRGQDPETGEQAALGDGASREHEGDPEEHATGHAHDGDRVARPERDLVRRRGSNRIGDLPERDEGEEDRGRSEHEPPEPDGVAKRRGQDVPLRSRGVFRG